MTTALLVAARREDRERMGAWIEGAGFDVELCPGPTGPESCLGLKGVRCPLAGAADVVVLDMGTDHDPLGSTVSLWDLLDAYQAQGLPVIALTQPGDGLFTEGSAVRVLRRPAERGELLDTIRRAVRSRARVGPGF